MESTLQPPAKESAIPFFSRAKTNVVRHRFRAVLPPGVCEKKLIALIAELDAKVRKAEKNLLVLEVGKRLWFRNNRTRNDLPVIVEMRINTPLINVRSESSVSVEMHSRKRVAKQLFEKRCQRVLRTIHECLMWQPSENA